VDMHELVNIAQSIRTLVYEWEGVDVRSVEARKYIVKQFRASI